MTTIAYIRVSTDKQARSGLGLEAQTDAILAYCSLYQLPNFQLIEDNGYSANSISGRPGMTSLVERVKAGEVSAVVVHKMDRMFRSIRDALETFELFTAEGVKFHSVVEKWDTSTAMGEAMLNIVLVFAQLERRMTGERTSQALQAKKARNGGKQINGGAPYGYRWENGKLVEHPDEYPVLQQIMVERGRGQSPVDIAYELIEAHIPTRSGGPWTERGVKRILAGQTG